MELIRDQKGGAATVKFKDMTTEELRKLAVVFPDAMKEYLKRVPGTK